MIAINTFPQEDREAEALASDNRFTMKLLKVPTENWVTETYGLQDVPEVFLLDSQNRIVFRPIEITDEQTQRILELQIEALLGH
jgi:hypothetical protein